MIAAYLTESVPIVTVTDPSKFGSWFRSNEFNEHVMATRDALLYLDRLIKGFENYRKISGLPWWYAIRESGEEGKSFLFVGGVFYDTHYRTYQTKIYFLILTENSETRLISFEDSVESLALSITDESAVKAEQRYALAVFKKIVRCGSEESIRSTMIAIRLSKQNYFKRSLRA